MERKLRFLGRLLNHKINQLRDVQQKISELTTTTKIEQEKCT